jgi:hypothetical protein
MAMRPRIIGLKRGNTRVATGMIANIKSPLDQLSQLRKKSRKKPGKNREEDKKDSPPA